MPWFQIIDTTTGAKHNALANDVAGAKRMQAIVAANTCPGRRGTVVEGTRYVVDGETFDVAFYEEALQGAQPSRSARRTASERAISSRYEQYDDVAAKARFDSLGRGW